MRENRFNIWTGEKMLYDNCYILIDSSDGMVWENQPKEGYDNLIQRDDWIPLQFIGLYDITGKEIHEGDIIENKRGRVGEVIRSEDRFSWIHGQNWGEIEVEFDEIRVIGNIHENKLILKNREKAKK